MSTLRAAAWFTLGFGARLLAINIRGEDLDNDAGHLMVGAPTLNAAATPTAVGKQRRKRPSTRPNSRD